uniref:Ig-like domain-containing protein n=1 Tax=Glossina brevipalpis TaxID=37001 RepID=A0A1A9W811_9MUSC
VNANTIRPFLHIERPNITRLIITQPRLPHYLSCNATIEPSYYHSDTKYYYTWFRNDNILPRNDFVLYRNGTLRLPPKEKASGNYRCKINADTTAVISESITVEYPVLRKLRANVNYTTALGNPLTLNCPIQSIPPANVSWYYGNVSLSKIFNDNRRVKIKTATTIECYLILSNGSLVLRNPKLIDAGKYKCLAHNSYALKTHHRQFVFSLSVINSPMTKGKMDQLVSPLQAPNLYVPLNGDLNLSCCAIMDEVTIEWWFQRNAKSPLVKLTNNSREYHIRSSIEEYEGFYTCSTISDKQTFHVIVTKIPIILEELPVDEANIASSKTFRCLATGNPRPVITWYHNGEPFNSSYTRYINANELYIPSFDPDESGIYQCFARNIAGEVYSSGELRLRNQSEVILNPLKNIKCYPHTFNSINVTFENQAAVSLFVVHIGLNKPFRWISPFPPMKLNASYVIIYKHLPYIRPFEIVTRVLIPTSDIRMGNKQQQQTILSTLRSMPVTCCTQGLPPRFVHIGNDTFVTWSITDLSTKKYFIIQFSINHTSPNPEVLLAQPLSGTMQHVNLTQEDINHKLRSIETLNLTETKRILKNAMSNYSDNEVSNNNLEVIDDVFSLVVPANVTGLMLRNFTRLKVRVLVITTDNEHMAQDFRYVEWRTVSLENDTGVILTAPYRLTMVESRMLRFHFDDSFTEHCVLVCYLQIHYPRLLREERKCEQRPVDQSQLEIRTLKPTTHYSLHFSSCDTNIFYGQLDVITLPDPPGPISNQRVTRHNGLKLSWDPPLQPNGKVHHYNILWTLGNVTHEANVFECSVCFYKFPNISESAKINVSVRVVGETGVGAPIFIDLRNINHRSLEIENSGSNSELYSGIAIGSLLSALCIFAFAILIMVQRKRFKARQQGPTHLSTSTDINFGNLSNSGLPIGSAGGLSTSTMPPDCHEMQTLIPRIAGRHTDFLGERPLEYQTTQLPNGHGGTFRTVTCITDPNTSVLSEFDVIGEHNLSVVPLCKTSPQRRIKSSSSGHDINNKPFFIPFKNTPPNVVAIPHNQSSSSVVNVPPSSLPLAASPLEVAANSIGARRSSSLSSANNGNNATSLKTKQFHTNFPKHAKSIDGICLLAEEESASTITPTSDNENNAELLTNGFKIKEEVKSHQIHTDEKPTVSKTVQKRTNQQKANSNNSKQKRSSTGILTTFKVPVTTTATAVMTTATDAQHANTLVPTFGSTNNTCVLNTPNNYFSGKVTITTAANTASIKAAASTLQDTNYRQPNMDPNG